MLSKVVKSVKLGRPFASSSGCAVPLYSSDMDGMDPVEDEIEIFFDGIRRKGFKSLNLNRLTNFVSTTFLDRQVFLDKAHDYDFGVLRTVEAVKEWSAQNSETQDVSLD